MESAVVSLPICTELGLVNEKSLPSELICDRHMAILKVIRETKAWGELSEPLYYTLYTLIEWRNFPSMALH